MSRLVALTERLVVGCVWGLIALLVIALALAVYAAPFVALGWLLS